MSTTFGVKIPSTGEVVEVARRIGVGNGNIKVYFIEPLAELLPDELEVVAIDNSPQGIYTIGDIKEKMKE
jgi:ribose 5-phosphate isomerase